MTLSSGGRKDLFLVLGWSRSGTALFCVRFRERVNGASAVAGAKFGNVARASHCATDYGSRFKIRLTQSRAVTGIGVVAHVVRRVAAGRSDREEPVGRA